MRASRQLRATVKSATRYLEANTPTGLTGLPTHPSPRPALLYTYNETLQKLKQLPQSSVYRQSAEALTKHRLSIVESAKPDGYDEWLVRVKKQIESDPASYGKLARDNGSVSHEYLDETPRIAWDGTVTRRDAKKEGSNTQTEAEQKAAMVRADVEKTDREAEEGTLKKGADLEVEPALTANQYVKGKSCCAWQLG